MCLYPQSIQSDPHLPSEPLPLLDLRLILYAKVFLNRIAILRSEPLHARFKALMPLFLLFWWIVRWWRFRFGFLSEMFPPHIASNAQKIERRIADIGGSDLWNLLGHTVNSVVGQVLRRQTASAGKDLDQPAPDLFVFRARCFSVRIEPGEQLVKGLLREVPALFCGRSAGQGRLSQDSVSELIAQSSSDASMPVRSRCGSKRYFHSPCNTKLAQ